MDAEMVKMSPKGQLVVPQDIREMEGFKPGDRFVSFPIKEGVVFKKIDIPEVKMKFDKLSKEIEAEFKRKKISKKEVSEAIKWARRK